MADRRRLAKQLILIGGWGLAATFAQAQPVIQPQDSGNAALELRVNQLASELRCLVCQNQTIADSHAELAVQLKNEVRTQLAQGRSDDEVRDFMVTRYGDFVLYRPPVSAATALLWAGPAVLLLIGLGLLVQHIRARQRLDAASASGLDSVWPDEPNAKEQA
ncbi:MAG: cytochrome c-type biogenesis protein CcmH [Aquabacterium sp.]|uniref:cytochrome c-type biogenesis protein n=1 Tax=Aquabacterium sp. TaxID=1872578 RepID=UPI002A36043F|nr:cytochrome c-type biogenesis protein [Aquabacterium sp.]MDX9845194.1 cytochrome c-type biogenesis protein CcmH [Aquabacterium sp.]